MSTGTAVVGAACHAAALLGVYLVTGPVRATCLDPALGHLAGSVVEASAFVLASVASVALVLDRLPHRWAVTDAMAAGLGALLLLGAADALVAGALCGVPLDVHFGRFATGPGLVQAAALSFHVLAAPLWLCEARADSLRRPAPEPR